MAIPQPARREPGSLPVRRGRLPLAAADISGATFTLCDLHRCELQGIRGIEALRGARIPLADLLPITPLLADALGIIATG
jgi:hypothetical protein